LVAKVVVQLTSVAIGSKNIVADDLFVPAHRVLAIADLAAGISPGTRINTNPLYRQSFLSVVPVTLIAPVLGMAEGALADFVDMGQHTGEKQSQRADLLQPSSPTESAPSRTVLQ
jgi:hypothetical protein